MRILRILTLLLVAMLPFACAQTASAAPVDSSISGVYLAPDRVCLLTVARHTGVWNGSPQAWWVKFDLRCVTFAGQYRASTIPPRYVYTGCPSYGVESTIDDFSALPNEYTSIRSSTATTLSAIVGTNQISVINGIGTPQTWIRVASLASPAPYSCASPALGKPGL